MPSAGHHTIMTLNRYLPIIILISVSACQTTLVTQTPSLPTLLPFPSELLSATMTTTATASPTLAPTATITDTPTFTMTWPPTKTATPTQLPTEGPSPTPSMTPTPLPSSFIFGASAGGRQLIAHRAGTGAKIILLVGGVHAGYESNTIELVEALWAHFAANPTDIADGVTLLFVPVLNPDGYARGRVLEGRFNGNGVDLNRNWGCGWSEQAEWRLGAVNPGAGPFSEPETQALGALIQQTNPMAVLLYHGAANGVYAGDCGGAGLSFSLAAVYGEASGYPYGAPFSEYALTGTIPNWLESYGIPAVDIELATSDGIEFARNLRGVIAVQSWVVQSR